MQACVFENDINDDSDSDFLGCTMVQTVTVYKYIEQRTQTINKQFV